MTRPAPLRSVDPAGRTSPPQKPLKAWLAAIEQSAAVERQPARLLGDFVDAWAERDGDRPALLSDAGTVTYAALSERIDRYARWAVSVGLRPGETVVLVMPNRPDYLAVWLGITRVGGVVALINTNLVGGSLAHCLSVAGASHAIVAAECAEAVEAALSGSAARPVIWLHGGSEDRGNESRSACSIGATTCPPPYGAGGSAGGRDGWGSGRIERGGASYPTPGPSSQGGGEMVARWPSIEDALAALGPERLAPSDRPPVTIADPALLIYTSGTTGLPKAARVSHRRVLHWGAWFAGLTGATPDDRMYDCLPLYHSVGGCVATGAMLVAGGSVVVAERFSASRFWDDVVRHGCTMFQYIGELCRYLLAAPPVAAEHAHRLRLCCGNGLKGDVWEAFQARFRIPQILEFYAATEGNFSLYNVEGKPGAIGRIPPFLQHRFPAAIVRIDDETGLPLRDAAGRCIPCERGEAGEAIGRIGTADAGGGRFEGYTNAAETGRKVLRDVLADGDSWFRTGDLMRQDEAGFFHFVDRVGDTFRWKGENVSTSEVAAAITSCPGVVDASVYGVAVPGADGRAGMAAIVAAAGFDAAALARHLSARLPNYAIPVFLRLRPALDLTETFKQKKADLVREGYDLAGTTDPLLVRRQDGYVPLDRAAADAIASGSWRL